MDVEPIISLNGWNGKIELFSNFIRINRDTFGGFLYQDLNRKKDIFFNDIVSIQIKKSGLNVGYLQILMPGMNENVGGILDVARDDYTIVFTGNSNYELALKIKEYIEENKQRKEYSSFIGSADEIGKLHSLMVKGIITKEEFDRKKGKLLE